MAPFLNKQCSLYSSSMHQKCLIVVKYSSLTGPVETMGSFKVSLLVLHRGVARGPRGGVRSVSGALIQLLIKTSIHWTRTKDL